MKEAVMRKFDKKKIEPLPEDLRKDCGIEPEPVNHTTGSMDQIYLHGLIAWLGFSSHSFLTEKGGGV